CPRQPPVRRAVAGAAVAVAQGRKTATAQQACQRRQATHGLRNAVRRGKKAARRKSGKRRPSHVHHARVLGRKLRSPSLIRGASPLALPYTLSRAPLRRRASASAEATARPRRSACGAKAGRSRGSLATLARITARYVSGM